MATEADPLFRGMDFDSRCTAPTSQILQPKRMKVATKSHCDSVVSANELTSLSALIVYVAHYCGDNEFRVERRLADRFNVANVKFLPTVQFDNAIRYLVDSLPPRT